MTLRDKLQKLKRFIASLKQIVGREYGVERVATHRLHLVVIFVARKLVTNEHVADEIKRTHDQQIPRLAEIRSKDLFQAVVTDHHMFGRRRMPKSVRQASLRILRK